MTRLRRLLTILPVGQLLRFTVVGGFAALVQLFLLWLLVDGVEMNYLLAAVLAIEFTIVLQYAFNNAWTFRPVQNTGWAGYLRGLLRTNLVRGSAIPMQIGLLYAFVEWVQIAVLPANALAILISGLYRYTLDARWTWGS